MDYKDHAEEVIETLDYDAYDMLKACLKHMSQADVKGMLEANDYPMEIEIWDEDEEVEAYLRKQAAERGNSEMKEDSYLAALKIVKEAQNNGKITKDVLKQAFAVLKK